MRVNCQMTKALYMPEDAHWDRVTNMLIRAGIRYTPSRNTISAKYPVNTLAITHESMWLTSRAKNSDAVTIGQNEIDQLALLEHSPEALLEWLFNL